MIETTLIVAILLFQLKYFLTFFLLLSSQDLSVSRNEGEASRAKLVLKVDIHDDKDKQKAMKAVSGLPGINSLSVDINEQKMTVLGEVDPVDVVGKLKKNWYAKILTVGPPQDEKKTEETKKEEGKKDETKKEEKKKDPNEQIAELVKAYKAYNPHMTTHYHVVSCEEDPNSCVIV